MHAPLARRQRSDHVSSEQGHIGVGGGRARLRARSARHAARLGRRLGAAV
jgi:hypothetical protein